MNKTQAIRVLLRQVSNSRRKIPAAGSWHVHSGGVPRTYLELMGLTPPVIALLQIAVGATTILTGAVAILSSFSPEYHGVASSIVLVIGLSTIPASLVFLVGSWPSPTLLYGFVAYCDVTIAAGLLLKDDQLFSIGGTALFAGVTILCVATTPTWTCALHVGFTFVCLAVLAARAALNGSDLWIVAAHSLTMVLTFTSPCLLLVQVIELRARAHSAQLDPLTGLYNRRGLFAALESLPPRSERDGNLVVSIAIIDLDHFKKINDRHGHLAGDEALVAVSAQLRSIAPDCLAIARVGGDEFAFLWGGPEDDVARSVARTVGSLRGGPILPVSPPASASGHCR